MRGWRREFSPRSVVLEEATFEAEEARLGRVTLDAGVPGPAVARPPHAVVLLPFYLEQSAHDQNGSSAPYAVVVGPA